MILDHDVHEILPITNTKLLSYMHRFLIFIRSLMKIEGQEEFICYFLIVIYDMGTCTFNLIFLLYLFSMHLIVSECSCLCPSTI